jgi:membrane-bound inhibitor of C-type lysozyme
MAIEWNRVTWYSQIIAIILALVIFGLGYWVGQQAGIAREDAAMDMQMQSGAMQMPMQEGTPVVVDVTYACDGGKTVRAIYKQNEVNVLLSDGRNLVVPHALSADGGRYANDDESFVFWNKGTTAFITEGAGDTSTTTFANCNQVSQPQ